MTATTATTPDPTGVTDDDEKAAAAMRDLAAVIAIRVHELQAHAVTPEHLTVVAMAAALPPAVPSAVPVLHLRNAAGTARTLAGVLDMWADRLEAR